MFARAVAIESRLHRDVRAWRLIVRDRRMTAEVRHDTCGTDRTPGILDFLAMGRGLLLALRECMNRYVMTSVALALTCGAVYLGACSSGPCYDCGACGFVGGPLQDDRLDVLSTGADSAGQPTVSFALQKKGTCGSGNSALFEARLTRGAAPVVSPVASASHLTKVAEGEVARLPDGTGLVTDRLSLQSFHVRWLPASSPSDAGTDALPGDSATDGSAAGDGGNSAADLQSSTCSLSAADLVCTLD